MIIHASPQLAIFLPALYGGGAERTLLKLAVGIAARGYKVDLVLARTEGPYLAEVPRTVRIVNLNARRVLSSLPAFTQYLNRERPRALLSGLHTNLIALWAKRLARVPTRVVVSERNMLSCRTHYYASDLRLRLMPYLVRHFYPWADNIVAVSKEVADDLIKTATISSERIRVIYNPVVTPELQARAGDPLKHPWFDLGEPPVILAAGRLTAQKDYPTLINAFARIRRVRPARLLILGEGEERAALEEQVGRLRLEQDVCLPGFVSNPFPYMRRASVFVLSSRWEGLPGVLIEAMYCGAPLIATDCPGGSNEVLAGGRYGRLVPVGDVNALADAIEATLDNKFPPPPQESWQPFQLEYIVDQYSEVLFDSEPSPASFPAREGRAEAFRPR
jgi:glycosyltransferase involved in cell wall biosynthesis